jgi:hypothetical protein
MLRLRVAPERRRAKNLVDFALCGPSTTHWATRAQRKKGIPVGLYAALIYSNEKSWESADESVTSDVMDGHNKFGENNGAVLKGGHALQGSDTATTLRRDAKGDLKVTDGPFAETKESLGGFYVFEASDLDTAIKIAQDIPMPFGGVEVRPIQVFD